MPQCMGPGCLRLVKGNWCDEHAVKGKGRRPWYGGDWGRFSRAMIDAWVADRGPLCVGWGVPPHMVSRADLCLDHVRGRSLSRDPADYQVLCRSCNGAKGDRDAVEGAELRR